MATKFNQTATAAAAAEATISKNAEVLRKLNGKAKPEAVKPEVAEEIVEPAVSSDTWFERMREAADNYFASINTPTWTRRVVSITLGLMSYGTVFYGCMQLVDVLVMATITYTGLGFISFMVAFLGILASLILATTVGTKVYEVAMVFDYKNVKSRVASWFSFEPKEIAHA